MLVRTINLEKVFGRRTYERALLTPVERIAKRSALPMIINPTFGGTLMQESRTKGCSLSPSILLSLARSFSTSMSISVSPYRSLTLKQPLASNRRILTSPSREIHYTPFHLPAPCASLVAKGRSVVSSLVMKQSEREDRPFIAPRNR